MSPAPYITLKQAKDQLSLDDGITIWDDRIEDLIGSGIDWAENYTRRSLSELLILNSPADSNAVAKPDPKVSKWNPEEERPGWFDDPSANWETVHWHYYWQWNPIAGATDEAQPLRRDVRAGILLYIESLFDRNTDNFELLEARAMSLLDPYVQDMGV